MMLTAERLHRHREEVIEEVNREQPEITRQEVLRFLESLDNGSYIDREVLWELGETIGVSKHAQHLPEDWVATWIGVGASPARQAIAAAFLTGYWRQATSVDRRAKDMLLTALPSLPQDSMAYAASLEALAELALFKRHPLNDDDRRALRVVLLKVLGELRGSGLHPGTAAMLSYLERSAQ